MPSLSEFLTHATQHLRSAGLDEPQREARALLAGVLVLDRAALLAQGKRPLTAAEQLNLAAALARRSTGEPLARLLGHKEFWGLDFALNAATLVPRPDSETLIEAALECFPDKQAQLNLLDLGTGSGCLLLSLLHEYPHAIGLGIDLAPEAVMQAAANAAALGLAGRTQFMTADWNEADFCQVILSGFFREKREAHPHGHDDKANTFDLILSNPPYIATPVIATLQRDVRDFDPMLALDGGVDGLNAYRRIIALLPALLTKQGTAILEIGYDQGDSVPRLFHATSLTPVLRRDLSGHPRCILIHHTDAKDS